MSNYNTYSNQWITKKSSSQHYAHTYLEKPALWQQVNDYLSQNLNLSPKVLVLGCGSGEEIEQLLKMGIESITAIDISSDLIEYASQVYLPFWKESYPQAKIELICQDITKYEYSTDYFDLIISSLTLHYIQNWDSLLSKLNRSLKSNGELIFSTHHPIKWASQTSRSKDSNSFIIGYQKSKTNNGDYQIWGDYLGFRAIKDKLFGQLEVVYYNRSISRIFQELKSNNFTITDLIEPIPTEETKSIKPDFWQVHSKIPLFVIFRCQKKLEISNKKQP